MFWADVDTNPDDGGFVWYRIADSPDLKDMAGTVLLDMAGTVQDNCAVEMNRSSNQ